MPLINERYVGHRPELWEEQTGVTFIITKPPNEAVIPEPYVHEYMTTIESTASREDLSRLLKEGTVSVTFETANGEIKTILCTTNESTIPAEAQPKTQPVSLRDIACTPDPSSLKIAKPSDPNLFKVYAIDRQGWRSFRYERVKSYYPFKEQP